MPDVLGPLVGHERLDDDAGAGGDVRDHPGACEVAGVGAREHEPGVDAVDDPLRAQRERDERGENDGESTRRRDWRSFGAHPRRRRRSRRRRARGVLPRDGSGVLARRTRVKQPRGGAGELQREQRGEQADDREDRQQPAAEVAALAAHEGEVEQRRGHEHPAEAALAPPDGERAAERGERGDPAETPGEGPEVVDDAALVWARRACLRLRLETAGLVRDPLLEVVEVEDRVGVRRAGTRRARRSPVSVSPTSTRAPRRGSSR